MQALAAASQRLLAHALHEATAFLANAFRADTEYYLAAGFAAHLDQAVWRGGAASAAGKLLPAAGGGRRLGGVAGAAVSPAAQAFAHAAQQLAIALRGVPGYLPSQGPP